MEGAVPPRRVYKRSSLASGLTGDHDSGDSGEQEETSTRMDSLAKESLSTEWTDEKHSLYLKSMEASFVHQLHNSLDLSGWNPHKDLLSDSKSSRHMQAGNCIPSGQFKVLRDGSWANINFKREASQLAKADNSCVLLASPWIRHFRSACRHQMVTSPAVQERDAGATTSERFPASHSHLWHQVSVGSNTEVVDQNFVDEDVEGERASKMCSTKRKKTSVVAASGNDQVVPFGKFPVTEDVPENCISLKD